MKKILLTLVASVVITGCTSTKNEPNELTSYIIDRKLISVYDPIPDGKYAKFYDWGREYSRMHSQLARCETKNILTGKFVERVKVASMVLGKDKYNEVMWGMRDQANQLAANAQNLPYHLFNEYHGGLSEHVCKKLENTSNQIIFDTLDFGIKWREITNNAVVLSEWPVYQIFASALGTVTYNSEGYVERDEYGQVILAEGSGEVVEQYWP